MYKINDTVLTPDGLGTVVVLEKYRVKRYGVELIDGRVWYYFAIELKKV
jgi:hypothetical protein